MTVYGLWLLLRRETETLICRKVLIYKDSKFRINNNEIGKVYPGMFQNFK